MFLVYPEVAKWYNEDEVVDVAFLEFTKAFDVFSHQLLLEKLNLSGFDKATAYYIKSSLSGHLMSVTMSRS